MDAGDECYRPSLRNINPVGTIDRIALVNCLSSDVGVFSLLSLTLHKSGFRGYRLKDRACTALRI